VARLNWEKANKRQRVRKYGAVSAYAGGEKPRRKKAKKSNRLGLTATLLPRIKKRRRAKKHDPTSSGKKKRKLTPRQRVALENERLHRLQQRIRHRE
jgi:hypothetical protein